MIILYFSATGNSLYVAKRLGGQLYSIPKLLKEGKFEFEDDKIGIVYPVYNMSVPPIVREFLSKATLKSDYIFTVATTGHPFGTTTKQMQEIGKSYGIKFSYSMEIGMVDNFLPGFDMEKQLAKEPSMNIEDHIDKVIKDITNKKSSIQKTPLIFSFIGKLIKMKPDKSSLFPELFKVEDSCNGCTICAKVCPVDNISVNSKPLFGVKCINCLACVQHCPQAAIRIKKEKGAIRFKNQHITTKEIIDANN